MAEKRPVSYLFHVSCSLPSITCAIYVARIPTIRYFSAPFLVTNRLMNQKKLAGIINPSGSFHSSIHILGIAAWTYVRTSYREYTTTYAVYMCTVQCTRTRLLYHYSYWLCQHPSLCEWDISNRIKKINVLLNEWWLRAIIVMYFLNTVLYVHIIETLNCKIG